MIAEHEPRLHALTVSPALARSGETVTFAFRLRNHGARATAPAVVRFVLDTALEPIDPIDVVLKPAAPGALLSAQVRARVREGLDDRTELLAHVMVTFDEYARSGHAAMQSAATNVCTVVVRTDACLDGDASGTSIERIDADRCRVVAWTINEGDGPAKDVALVLDVPDGCARDDAGGAARASTARLPPGERLETAMDVSIIAPRREVRADGARVTSAGSRVLSLRCARPLLLAAELDQPQIELVAYSGRATVMIDVHNAGWVDARDVTVTVDLPAALRVVGTSLTVDRIAIPLRKSARAARTFASAATTQTGLVIALARVAARSSTRMLFDVQTPADGRASTIDVRICDHTVSAAVCAPAIPEIRLRAVDLPAWIESGVEAAISIEVVNAGITAQTIDLSLEGAAERYASAKIALPARGITVATLCVIAPAIDDCENGALPSDGAANSDGASRLVLTAVARVDDREIVREDVVLAVRTAITPAASSLSPDSGQAAVHRGDARPEIADNDAAAELVEVTLSAPPTVTCGTQLTIRATIIARNDIGKLVLRAHVEDSCVYVPGSLTVDGRGVAEPDDGTPAVAALTLGAVASGTLIGLAWAIVPVTIPADGFVTLGAGLDADGVATAAGAVRVAVEDRVPFARWSPSHAYFIDASTIDEPYSAPPRVVVLIAPHLTTAYDDGARLRGDAASQFGEPATTESEGFASHQTFAAKTREAAPAPDGGDEITSNETVAQAAPRIDERATRTIVLRCDDDWRDQTRRLLQRSHEPGLLVHIFVLRALFPNRTESSDASLAHALDTARIALRDVFDRLFVKIRIPGFPVAADDIEDQSLRDALSALFETLAASNTDAADGGPVHTDTYRAGAASAEFCARIDSAQARAALTMLARAPRGAPSVLRSIVTLLPAATHGVAADRPEQIGAMTASAHSAEIAASRFVRELDAAVAAFDDEPAYPFDAALMSGLYHRLDAARDALVAALGGRAADPVGW